MSHPRSPELKEDRQYLDRIPVKNGNEIQIVPVSRVASVVARGESLHIVTVDNARHVMNYRLKDLETRLDPTRFVRLGRGAIAALDAISKVTLATGGTHVVLLTNGQELRVSRMQARTLRDTLLTL